MRNKDAKSNMPSQLLRRWGHNNGFIFAIILYLKYLETLTHPKSIDIFLNFSKKQALWVLIRSALLRHFLEVISTHNILIVEKYENIFVWISLLSAAMKKSRTGKAFMCACHDKFPAA